jgi:hypothetical protein
MHYHMQSHTYIYQAPHGAAGGTKAQTQMRWRVTCVQMFNELHQILKLFVELLRSIWPNLWLLNCSEHPSDLFYAVCCAQNKQGARKVGVAAVLRAAVRN